uniref:type II toxin-antitoxin system RelE/ParE family toxin n=1 Tax=Endozoicomonas sp. Mp262 TaxID=2919499 RepID=UPI00351B8ABA
MLHQKTSLESDVFYVRSVAKMLKENPLMGKIGRIHGTRELIVADTPLTLIYVAEKELINILFVSHHRQRWS